MHLSAVLKDYGLNPKELKIVRHPLNKKDVKVIYNRGFIETYQSHQGKPVFDKIKYVVTFIGTVGNTARFIGVYEVKNRLEGKDREKAFPKDYPYLEQSNYGYFYVLEKTDIMADLQGRLVIDWPNPVSWCQWGTTDKDVLSISPERVEDFPGYENICKSYDEIAPIFDDGQAEVWQKWRDTLKNVNGVYLICDIVRNKQYIGSTYNPGGIYKRWEEYIESYHGGDMLIKKHLKKYPGAYHDFQFSILRTLPLTITKDEAIQIEKLYKKKLNTRNDDYGLNDN